MSVGELIESGLGITAIGMGVVFVLLTALVYIIQAMSALAAALQPHAPPPGARRPAPTAAPGDDAVIPVIAAAIAAYRGRHRNTSK